MKKTLSALIIMLLCCFSISAQEHIKFMGIPVDGTPAKFGKKLAKKGFKHKSDMLNGSRVYEGIFSGVPCDVMVGSRTGKEVTHVSAIIVCNSKNEATGVFSVFEQKLEKKYDCVEAEGTELERHIHCNITGGYIGMFIQKNTPGYGQYSCHITYYDVENMEKSKQQELDDL